MVSHDKISGGRPSYWEIDTDRCPEAQHFYGVKKKRNGDKEMKSIPLSCRALDDGCMRRGAQSAGKELRGGEERERAETR